MLSNKNLGRGYLGARKEVLRLLLPMLRMQRASKSQAEIRRVRHEAIMVKKAIGDFFLTIFKQKMLRQVPLRAEKTHQKAFKKVKKRTDNP